MNLPGNTFGKSVRNAALSTAVITAPFAYESGNPVVGPLIAGGVAAGIAAVNHIVRSVSNTNADVRQAQYDAKFEQAKADRKAAKEEHGKANSVARTASLNPHITKNYKGPK